MDQEESDRIEAIIAEYSSERLQSMIASTKDAVDAIEIGLAFMVQNLGVECNGQQCEKGTLNLASATLRQALDSLYVLLKKQPLKYWPVLNNAVPLDATSEVCFSICKNNLSISLGDDDRGDNFSEQLIESINVAKVELTSYLQSLVNLLTSWVETGRSQQVPVWDKEAKELRFRGQVVRRIHSLVKAHAIVIILDEFENEGWCRRVANPLVQSNLSQTLKSLRKGLSLIAFSECSVGGTTGICWNVIDV